MKEIVIQHFFEGHADAAELAADAAGAFDRQTDSAGVVFSRLHAIAMTHDFTVTPEHIAMLVEAVQANILDLEALDAICFCLEASDNFGWDPETPEGERVSESVFWLGTPEINYPLTPSVLEKIRTYLLTGQNTLTKEDTRSEAPTRLRGPKQVDWPAPGSPERQG